MKQTRFDIRLLPVMLLAILQIGLYGCKDDEIPRIITGPDAPESETTINEINANLQALQRMITAGEGKVAVTSCVTLSSTSYNIELADGNTFTVRTGITPLGGGDAESDDYVYSPQISVAKDGRSRSGSDYYWTLDGDWLTVNGENVSVASAVPQVGLDENKHWTVTCNNETQTMDEVMEEGAVKSVFKIVDVYAKEVAFTLNDESTSFTFDYERKEGDVHMGSIRRPIDHQHPAWIYHIDTWMHPDPQWVIDNIPEDIRPFVIFNISLSSRRDLVADGYSIAKSWLRVCAENNVWVMVQPASGAYSAFEDYASYEELEGTLYDEFFQYNNFVGFNYAEQSWGFGDPADPDAGYPEQLPSYAERIQHWKGLMKLTVEYGGYLTISFCHAQYGAKHSPVGMFKDYPEWADLCKQYSNNLIICEKFTSPVGLFQIESTGLGSWLSGYAGNYGMRFDQCGWNTEENQLEYLHNNEYWNGDQEFPVASEATALLEHIAFTGQTVFDGPELTTEQTYTENETTSTSGGYRKRDWKFFPQMEAVSFDIYRKIIDGTIRIMTREEVTDRTKIIILNDVTSKEGQFDPGYLAPSTLFTGLYKLDEDGEGASQRLWFKKTGRYPTIPTAYELADATARSFKYQLNASQFINGQYSNMADKLKFFNQEFPEEYTGDMYAGRYENTWVAYNAYKDIKSASIPFKYNTCDKMELSFAKYSSALIREYPNKVYFYLTNYTPNGPKVKDVIEIHGCTNEPSYTCTARNNFTTNPGVQASATTSWADGVFTLTVEHNGGVDITINCSGNATGRETQYTSVTQLSNPLAPNTKYTGPYQHEAEDMEYKNIGGYVLAQAYNDNADLVPGYTGMGFVNLGTGADAALRDEFNVAEARNYTLYIRYCATAANSNFELYVNNSKSESSINFESTGLGNWQTIAVPVKLNEGKNTIELKATGAGSGELKLDNFVLE